MTQNKKRKFMLLAAILGALLLVRWGQCCSTGWAQSIAL